MQTRQAESDYVRDSTRRSDSGTRRRWRLRLLLTLLITPALSGLLLSGNTMAFQPNLDALVKQSKFIFRGTVRKLNAATLAEVTPSGNTVVVAVDEVLQAPATLGDFTGQEITVQLSQPNSVKAGQRLVFFTNGWLYGKSLAVTEAGRLQTNASADTLRKQIAAANQRLADQALQQRLAQAELVVVGKVAAVRRSEQARRDFISEHEPDWWEAQLQIESVERGQTPQRNVTILYSNSTDVMWFNSPKFKVDQDGIWILRRNQKTGIQVNGLTALDSEDFLPRTQLDRVRRLLRAIR